VKRLMSTFGQEQTLAERLKTPKDSRWLIFGKFSKREFIYKIGF